MFSVRCPRHGRWVLLDASDMLSLTAGPDGGFVIEYRCSCGYEGHWPPASYEERCDRRMAG